MAAAQEGNRPPPDSGVLEKVNDGRLRNASAREAPPLQPSAAGRRGLYIQDIHTLQVYVLKDHCIVTATKTAKTTLLCQRWEFGPYLHGLQQE